MAPSSKYTVVAAPLGFTWPLTVALEVVMFSASSVVTVGAAPVPVEVMNIRSAPLLVPAALRPTMRK